MQSTRKEINLEPGKVFYLLQQYVQASVPYTKQEILQNDVDLSNVEEENIYNNQQILILQEHFR